MANKKPAATARPSKKTQTARPTKKGQASAHKKVQSKAQKSPTKKTQAKKPAQKLVNGNMIAQPIITNLFKDAGVEHLNIVQVIPLFFGIYLFVAMDENSKYHIAIGGVKYLTRVDTIADVDSLLSRIASVTAMVEKIIPEDAFANVSPEYAMEVLSQILPESVYKPFAEMVGKSTARPAPEAPDLSKLIVLSEFLKGNGIDVPAEVLNHYGFSLEKLVDAEFVQEQSDAKNRLVKMFRIEDLFIVKSQFETHYTPEFAIAELYFQQLVSYSGNQ
jgi:hypothetical protein